MEHLLEFIGPCIVLVSFFPGARRTFRRHVEVYIRNENLFMMQHYPNLHRNFYYALCSPQILQL